MVIETPTRTATLADREPVAAFVATLPPDAERDRLTDAYRERAALSTELATLPGDVAAVARKYAAALLAWSAYVYRQVLAEGDAATTAIDAGAQERIRIVRRLTTFEESTRNVTDHPEAYDQARAERAEIVAREAPIRQRRADAEAVLSAITMVLRQHFGDTVRGVTVEPPRVDQFVERVCKAAR